MNNKNYSSILLHVLFFASGFAALIYQVAWQRSLYTVLGGDIESITIVVTVFMLGLGFGALAGGALSRRFSARAVRVFSVIELLTGLYGFASLMLIGLIGRLPGAGHWATAGSALVVLLVPTCLMGASLPLLAEHVNRARVNAAMTTAGLYLANTLGAALASFLTVLIFFELLGLAGTVCCAALCNLVVGLAALALPGGKK
jgi:spermidine synthase